MKTLEIAAHILAGMAGGQNHSPETMAKRAWQLAEALEAAAPVASDWPPPEGKRFRLLVSKEGAPVGTKGFIVNRAKPGVWAEIFLGNRASFEVQVERHEVEQAGANGKFPNETPAAAPAATPPSQLPAHVFLRSQLTQEVAGRGLMKIINAADLPPGVRIGDQLTIDFQLFDLVGIERMAGNTPPAKKSVALVVKPVAESTPIVSATPIQQTNCDAELRQALIDRCRDALATVVPQDAITHDFRMLARGVLRYLGCGD